MTCPYCGGELEQGGVYALNSKGMAYLPAGKEILCFDTKRAVEKLGGIWLSGPNWFEVPQVVQECIRCTACKKIIISYEGKE